MLNHASPLSSRTGNRGLIKAAFVVPFDQPPPCTRMTAANGPGPSGMCACMARASPETREYTMSFLVSTPAASRKGQRSEMPTSKGDRIWEQSMRKLSSILFQTTEHFEPHSRTPDSMHIIAFRKILLLPLLAVSAARVAAQARQSTAGP